MTETTDTTDGTEHESREPPEPTIDRVCAVLKNQRRREVIRVLTETEQIALGDLTDRVAEVELGKPAEDITGQERKNVYVGLYQSHVPRMARDGVVTMDRREVGRGPRFDAYADALAGIEEMMADDGGNGLVGRLLGGGGP